jgi:hypothetical protein
VVAYEFEGAADIKIVDKDQKIVAKFEDADRRGRTKEEDARREELKRIAIFVAAGVIRTDPIRARLDDKKKALVDDYIASIEKKRAKAEEGETGEGGEENEK